MSESRKALVKFVFEEFNKVALADPQQQLVYKWQDTALEPLFAESDKQIHMNMAISDLNDWAHIEKIPGVGHTFYESDQPVMLYNARFKQYEVANKFAFWRTYQYIHEFTHYWLLSAFSLGYDECEATTISPLTGHGPVFARAFIMMLAKHHPAKPDEEALEKLATEAGVAVAAISGEDLRSLWEEWRNADFETDDEAARSLIAKTASHDRIEITGARTPTIDSGTGDPQV